MTDEKIDKKKDKRYLPRFCGLPSTSVGRVIYRYREKHGITMQEFARRCGLSSAGVYRIESAVVIYPRMDTLSKIAIGIGVSDEALIEMLMEDGYGREKSQKGSK